MTSRPLNKLLWFSRSLGVVLIVRLGLSFLNYTHVKSWSPVRRSFPPAPPDEQARCAWAIARAARFVPRASCLTQALAGQWLLAGKGFGSRVVIGVRRSSGQDIAAHAWLRVGDQVVLGGQTEDLSAFTELTELGVPA